MSIGSSTKKLLVVLIALNALLVSAYGLGFWLLRAQNLRIAALNAEVDAQTATSVDLSSLEKMLEEAESGVRKVDSYFIASDGVVTLIGTLESHARGLGLAVDIDGVEAQEIDKNLKGLVERVVLRLEVEGDWRSVQRYIALVETLPQKITVEAAQIDRIDPSEKDKKHAWRGSFLITALKLK